MRTPSEALSIYRGRRVFLTGHTGFKGGWLSLWLHDLGAEVHGYSLAAEGSPNLFSAIDLPSMVQHNEGDIRDAARVSRALEESRAEIIFHLAAQPLVHRSHREPLETFAVNTIGTATILEAVRLAKKPVAVVIVTSDKCYENDGSGTALREEDRLGGSDPYSASKAAAELVVQSYRRSFFPSEKLESHGVALASARGGNVIGGGDWAEDRIAVDAMRAFAAEQPLRVRNPHSTRPFQHIAELLAGYLLLGAKLLSQEVAEVQRFCRAWNFAPDASASVADLANALRAAWGAGARWEEVPGLVRPIEAKTLHLDASAAKKNLDWRARWDCEEAAIRTARWYRGYYRGLSPAELRDLARADMRDWLTP